MDAIPNDKAAAIRDVLSAGLEALKSIPDPSEADTQDQLIEPILEALGYSRAHTRRHVTDGGNYPDRIVWPVPAVEAEAGGMAARFVVEEKPLGADFQKPRSSRADTPARQIQRYLRQHRLAADSTVGILTDGRHWHLYERETGSAGDTVVVRRAARYDLLENTEIVENAPASALAPRPGGGVEAFVARLAAERFQAPRAEPAFFAHGRRFLESAVAAMRDDAPVRIVEALGGAAEDAIEPILPVAGLVADARLHDWEPGFVYALGPEYRPPEPRQGALPPPIASADTLRVQLAVVPFRSDGTADGTRLRKGDIGLCARGFAQTPDPLVLCAYARDARARPPAATMRVAVHAEGRTAMTPEFDPDIPPASVLRTLDALVRVLRGPIATRAPAGLTRPFDVLPLQRDFYARIEQWLRDRLREDADGAHDMAMVRHLIRSLFAWILREHGIVPRGLFDRGFVRAALGGLPDDGHTYHEGVLSALFHRALNLPRSRRPAHPVPDIEAMFRETPFLNGSIFAPHASDELVRPPNRAYWSDEPARPGLFDILSEFHWTLDEHSAQTNDQSLDPELLGALFERLVSLVDRTVPPARRKPKGTYYTPRDVVATMVSDALTARLLREDIPGVAEPDLRKLFSGANDDTPDWPEPARGRVRETLGRLSVFDPAVGSGIFLLGVLETLTAAFAKLDAGHGARRPRGATIRAIVRDQLHGCDIQPLAAQIAKLRLFLAIEAAEGAKTEPLPNLEARIVNADTLGTIPDPDWTPSAAGTLHEADPEFRRLLDDLVETRRRWFDAHDERSKRNLAEMDRRLRAALARAAGGGPVSAEVRAFAEWAPLALDDAVTDTDPRLVFGRAPRRGFDIVIGNPPYGALSAAERKRAEAKGYRARGAGRIEALFVELAMALADPDLGVVEFVLPLGVSFRQDHERLRTLAERSSERIELRHYDMTPGRIFNTDPTAKSWPNKQRAILMTASRGAGGRVFATGLRRWFEMPGRNERAASLANRRAVEAPRLGGAGVDRRIAGQWLRVPTAATRALVETLARADATVGSLLADGAGRGFDMGLPHTAYQYVTALPAGQVTPRRERRLRFRTEEAFKVALAAFNGHVFYAWWLAADDGFDVNVHVATAMGLPDPWTRPGPERDRAIALADRLVAAIPDCLTGKLNAGVQWRNVDFFSGAPDLVEELDRLHLAALGLPWEPTIRHLRTLRSSSSYALADPEPKE